MDKVKFGPSGNSISFYEQGNKHTYQAPLWLYDLGLELFEYSFGRGVNLSSDTASLIAEQAKKYNIEISAHAPYYINLASEDEIKIKNSFGYVLQSLKALRALGGNRLVIHLGSSGKTDYKESVLRINKNVEKLIGIINENEYSDMILCPETMGKAGQVGDTQGILKVCKISSQLLPTFDFGHINSRGCGVLKCKNDYRRELDMLFESLDEYRARNIHIHFSKIQYGAKGEIRHLTLADTEYGPEFEPLAELIKEYKMTPHILCESDGTQAEDACQLKAIYAKL